MPQPYDFYKAEYIWVDGTAPTHKLRSKGKVVFDTQRLAQTGIDTAPDGVRTFPYRDLLGHALELGRHGDIDLDKMVGPAGRITSRATSATSNSAMPSRTSPDSARAIIKSASKVRIRPSDSSMVSSRTRR